MEKLNRKSVVIFLPNLAGGGAQHVSINLASAFIAAGYDVTFFLQKGEGELLGNIPEEANVFSPGATRTLGCLLPLIRFLQTHKVDILLSHLPHNNLIAIMASWLSGTHMPVITCFHNTLSMELLHTKHWRAWLMRNLCKWLLPKAKKIVAVSEGVARDLAGLVPLPADHVTTIYNPVITQDFETRLNVQATHPWLSDQKPFLLAAGRLTPQKDFDTLIRAFSKTAQGNDLRLIILGDGPLRRELESTIRLLKLQDRISLPGYVPNILPFLCQARMFILSSRYEGFANVLAEALACGTPVISTDCPHGPREILGNGKYGMLVPVADADAMAIAIRVQLLNMPSTALLQARGREFSVEKSATAYIKLFA